MGFCARPLLYAMINLLGSFTFGWIMTYPAPALPEIQKIKEITLFEATFFNSICSLFGVVGAFFAQIMIRFTGNKIATFTTALLGLLISIGLPFLTLKNIWFGIASRAICGIVVGSYSAIIPLNIKLLAPPEYINIYGIMSQFGITFGGTCCFFISVVIDWKFLSYFVGIVNGLLCIFIWFVPLQQQTQPQSQTQQQSSLKSSPNTDRLFQKKYIRPLIIGIGVMFFQQFSGVNGIVTNLNDLFDEAGITIPKGVASGIAASAQVFAAVFAGGLIFKFGRKIVWMLSLVGSGLFLVIDGISIKFGHSWPKFIPIFIIFGYLLLFGLGLGPIPWFIIPEVFPFTVSSSAVSLCTMINWISSFTVISTYKYLVNLLGNFGCMLVYAGVCFVGGAFGYFLIPNASSTYEPEIILESPDDYNVYDEPALIQDEPQDL